MFSDLYLILPFLFMTGFDELTCYCGAELMFPPIPCGAKPPECHRKCTKSHSCDHPGISDFYFS